MLHKNIRDSTIFVKLAPIYKFHQKFGLHTINPLYGITSKDLQIHHNNFNVKLETGLDIIMIFSASSFYMWNT